MSSVTPLTPISPENDRSSKYLLDTRSKVSLPVKKRRKRCDICMLPRFCCQIIFSIPSFIGCVVSTIVVILITAIILLFSIQSREAVRDVSLSVRDLSIASVRAHLDSLFEPQVSLTQIAAYTRMSRGMDDVSDNTDFDDFLSFAFPMARYFPITLFCANTADPREASALVRGAPIFGGTEAWRIRPLLSDPTGILSEMDIFTLDLDGQITNPTSYLTFPGIDNINQPYTKLVRERNDEPFASFTPLSLNVVPGGVGNFFNSYVVNFNVGSTKLFCWSSIVFGPSLSDFLANNQRFPNAVMMIVERDGLLVASSSVERVPNTNVDDERYSPRDIDDKDIRQAFISFEEEFDLETLSEAVRHESGPFFIDVVPYEGPSGTEGINWLVILLTPSDDILGKVVRSQNISLGVSVGVLFFGLILAYLTSFCITLPLFQIKNELQRVSRLQLDPRTPRFCQMSFLSEIRTLSTATSKLKSGLQSFERYVPSSVVQMILLENRAAQLGMKSHLLTALFSDIVSFTTLAEKEQPQSLVNQLEDYFTLVNAKLEHYELALISYIGDAVFAFATARDNPHHALKACMCALDIQEALSLLNKNWVDSNKPPLLTRIGVHSGEALVGNIGSFDRFSFTAIGDTINLAARLESINRQYQTDVCTSESTRAYVEGNNPPLPNVVFVPMDLVAVKGKDVAVTVYNLCNSLTSAMPRGSTGAEFDIVALYTMIIEDYKEGRYDQVLKRMEDSGEAVNLDPRLEIIKSKATRRLAGEGEEVDRMETK